MDLDSVADELYQASPDEFVERRKELAGEARALKDRELVKAINALRRPTRSAWSVNLLARQASDQVEALLDLGRELAEAQQRGSGPDLRRLSRERHVALEALTRRAVELAAAQGHTATEATRQEVSQTLQAALSDPTVADLVRAGRVIQPVSYGGFGPTDLFGGALASPPTAALPSEDQASPKAPAPQVAKQDPAKVEAEAVASRAAEALAAAQQAARDAEQAAEEATAAADELADRVESLRAQLADTESEERAASDTARTARKQHTQAQEALTAAELAAAEASRLLAEWEGG